MEELHNTVKYKIESLAPSEVQRTVLCSNDTVLRCTSLRGSDVRDTFLENEALDYLADIYLDPILIR